MKCWAVYFKTPVPYRPGTDLQEALLAARIADRIPDTVLFLEHAPVVTLGRRGRDHHLLDSPEHLAERGIELARASRGGDVTYHGPGQLVMYPVIKLGQRETGSHDYLYNLEQTAIDTAARFKVTAFRREGMAGAWTAAGKLAAIGFKLKRWVACHGMSFNVDLDPGVFEMMVPCGLADRRIATLAGLRGDQAPTIPEVRTAMTACFARISGRRFKVFERLNQMPEDLAGMVKTAKTDSYLQPQATGTAAAEPRTPHPFPDPRES